LISVDWDQIRIIVVSYEIAPFYLFGNMLPYGDVMAL
jgi:hypothetical protein